MIWKNERRKLSDLTPAKYNPRKMSPKQKADLNESIKKFDMVDPLIINTTGTIIGGHQRYHLLVAQGVIDVDVRVPERELNEVEEKELNLRLNQNKGEFDLGLLASFDPDMLITAGFDGDLVDTLFELESAEDDYDVQKEYEAIEHPRTVLGDVYEFEAGHRLLCGSSTLQADMERLMGGHKADLVYTDPPYNVAYKGKGGIKGDDQSQEDFCDFLTDAFTNAFIYSQDHVNLYVWFAMSNYTQFRSAIEGSGFRYMQIIQWLKERFTLSMGWYYHRLTEPCMIFYKDWKIKFVNPHYAKNADMWQMDRLTFEENLEIIYQRRDDAKDYQHPTQKPIRLAERALKKNSEVGHIVLDMFTGGGAALFCVVISCKGFVMEWSWTLSTVTLSLTVLLK